MEEIWKDVKNYEGRYQVSNKGSVRSLNFTKETKGGFTQNSPSKILKQSVNQKGYKVVMLYKEKKGTLFQVHRLVASAFIENPNNLPVINHKDENPQNNTVENLEWCTQRYNCNYSARKHIGRQTYEHKGSCRPKKAVIQYDLNGNYISEYSSIAEASRSTGAKVAFIYYCCTGQRKSTCGYKWAFK